MWYPSFCGHSHFNYDVKLICATSTNSTDGKSRMKASMKSLVALAAVASCATFPTSGAYPDQPLKIVATYATGGSSDVLARALSGELGK